MNVWRKCSRRREIKCKCQGAKLYLDTFSKVVRLECDVQEEDGRKCWRDSQGLDP